jgi:hypothetical protein
MERTVATVGFAANRARRKVPSPSSSLIEPALPHQIDVTGILDRVQ